jgi:hypothetical protein
VVPAADRAGHLVSRATDPARHPGSAGFELLRARAIQFGRELAVGFAQSMSSPVQLRIYSVTTGKLERDWSTRDKTVFGGGHLVGTVRN